MNTTGLIPVSDLPCLLHRSPDHIQRWLDQHVLTAVQVDGVAYVRRREVEPLRHPVAAVRAELDAAEAAGRPILSPEAMSLVVRVLSDALDSLPGTDEPPPRKGKRAVRVRSRVGQRDPVQHQQVNVAHGNDAD